MIEYVSISIPEPLVRRARELARLRQQPLDAVVAELLEQGLPDADASESDIVSFSIGQAEEAMARESAAYEAMHAELMAAHEGEFVAVFKGELVDHDADETALLRRVEAQFPNDVVLLKQVVPLPEPELRIRSPRSLRH